VVGLDAGDDRSRMVPWRYGIARAYAFEVCGALTYHDSDRVAAAQVRRQYRMNASLLHRLLEPCRN
jgi:hypothetical protein